MSSVRRGIAARALVLALAAGLWGCVDGEIAGPPEAKQTPPSPGVVALQAAASAPADGATQVRIVAEVDSALARDQRSVTFRTTAGVFPGGEREIVVAADSARTAVTVLATPRDTTTAVITATAGGGTRRTEVRFVPALPDLVEVTTDQVSVTAGFTGSVAVTAELRRSPGLVTPGHPVGFEAHAPGETQPRGRFTSETGLSNEAGRVVVRFTPADSVYTGPLVIVATTAGRNSVLRDSTVVQVVAPPR